MERHSARITGVWIVIAAWSVTAAPYLVSSAAEDGRTPHEPAILSLLGMGLLAIALATRQRKRR